MSTDTPVTSSPAPPQPGSNGATGSGSGSGSSNSHHEQPTADARPSSSSSSSALAGPSRLPSWGNGAQFGAGAGGGTGTGTGNPGILDLQQLQAQFAASQAGQGTQNGGVDWTANLQGMIPTGQSRDAIMKQLEALSSSKAHRDRTQSTPTPSQSSIPLPLPLPLPGSTPGGGPSAGPAFSAPSPMDPSRLPQLPLLPNGQLDMTQLSAVASTFTPEQREYVLNSTKARGMPNLLAQSVGSPANPNPNPTLNPTLNPNPYPNPNPNPIPNPNPARPPSGAVRPPRPGRSLDDQRTQFLQTYVSYHRNKGLPIHPDVMNGHKNGVIKLGETGLSFELMELFLAFMRAAQPFEEQVRNNPSPPILHAFSAQKGLPNPLPLPVRLPVPVNSNTPPQETTDPVQFLIAAFRVYLAGYDHHMSTMRAAAMRQTQGMGQHQQQQQQNQQAQAQAQAMQALQSRPVRPIPNANGAIPLPGVSPQVNSPANSPLPSAPTGARIGRPPKNKNKPTPINTQVQSAAAAKSATKKRKKGQEDGVTPSAPTPSAPTPSAISAAAPAPVAAFATTTAPVAVAPLVPEPDPKRARYKVEYRPVHLPIANLGGWDQNLIASSFPKHNRGKPTRSIHDLAIVDMDALLMGVKSRMPKELGYAITVLSMLSMAHPEDGLGGLPLLHITELYEELLELLAEKAFGEDGPRGVEPERVLFSELERMGRDMDWSIDASDYRASPDVVLSLLNLMRNFSMLPDNQPILASSVDLLHVLAGISDKSLCTAFGGSLFSAVEFARAQREAVAILTNIGSMVDLSKCENWAVVGIFRLLSGFLVPAWEMLSAIQSPYAPISPADRPPVILSVYRALEALCKLSQADSNREVLSRLPRQEIVEVFTSLVRLLPITPPQARFLHISEESLCLAEYLALTLYSLAFLAPPSARTEIRNSPGLVDVITRIILLSALPPQSQQGQPPQPHNLAILCRRLAETLGVLNGSWSPNGDAGVGASAGASAGAGACAISFSAGGIDGKGWTFKSRTVQEGWLGPWSDRVVPLLFAGGVEGVVWGELDALVWGSE